MNPELAQFEAMAKEILRRCMADEDPEEIRKWLGDTLARLGGGDDSAWSTCSFDGLGHLRLCHLLRSSCPGLSRASTSFLLP